MKSAPTAAQLTPGLYVSRDRNRTQLRVLRRIAEDLYEAEKKYNLPDPTDPYNGKWRHYDQLYAPAHFWRRVGP